jgi:hypothetical protein
MSPRLALLACYALFMMVVVAAFAEALRRGGAADPMIPILDVAHLLFLGGQLRRTRRCTGVSAPGILTAAQRQLRLHCRLS